MQRGVIGAAILVMTLGCGGKTDDEGSGSDGSGATSQGGSGGTGNGGGGIGAAAGTGGLACALANQGCGPQVPCCAGLACQGVCVAPLPPCSGAGAACGPGGCCSGLACGADGICAQAACMPVGEKCDYFAPNCCPGLECSLIGVCSEVASCSGLNQPCAAGCCPGLECTATGSCAPAPPPTCPKGTNNCSACLAQKCCPTLAQCLASPNCAKAYACLDGCLSTAPDPTNCVTQCDTGAPELKALALCGYQSCSVECF